MDCSVLLEISCELVLLVCGLKRLQFFLLLSLSFLFWERCRYWSEDFGESSPLSVGSPLVFVLFTIICGSLISRFLVGSVGVVFHESIVGRECAWCEGFPRPVLGLWGSSLEVLFGYLRVCRRPIHWLIWWNVIVGRWYWFVACD